MIKEILLDCDGVLADFLTPCLGRLNKSLGKNVSMEEYPSFNTFAIDSVFGITQDEMWPIIEEGDSFWCNLEPLPWAKTLYDYCSKIARVTICTSPSRKSLCASQKLDWLNKHLGLGINDVMIGGRKDLMARPENVLIDDHLSNIKKFQDAGGKTVLLPSSWNTYGLTEKDVMKVVEEALG